MTSRSKNGTRLRGAAIWSVWTDKELAILAKRYAKLGPYELVGLLPGRTVAAIRDKATRLGYRTTAKRERVGEWSRDEDAVVRKHIKHQPPYVVAKMLSGRSESSVRNRALRLGLIRPARRTWSADEDGIVCRHWPAGGIDEVIRLLPHKTRKKIEERAVWLGLEHRRRGIESEAAYDDPTPEEIWAAKQQLRAEAIEAAHLAMAEKQEPLFDDIELSEWQNVNAQFDIFWALYPRRVAKAAARTAFEAALNKRGVTLPVIREGVRNYCEMIRAEGTAEKYIKHPATWLKQERWNDEPPKSVIQKRLNKKHKAWAEAEKAAASTYVSRMSMDEFDKRVAAAGSYDHRITGMVVGPEGKRVLAKYAVAVWEAAKKGKGK